MYCVGSAWGLRNVPTASGIVPPVDDAALYSIGAVARMTGVAVGTLRTWEDRYQLVIATRSSGGQRRYSRRQLEQLLFVAGEVEGGTSPGDAHRLLADRDDRGGSQALDRSAESAVGILVLVAERDPFAASYVDAEQAERRFAQLAPQLVIVELLLSGGLGGALIEKLKRSPALIVAVSPLAAGEVSAALGADAFLQKPIDPMTLLSTVRDLLGTSALTASRVASAS
jgi:DNA-binding transcriptional MerR regulator